MNKIIINLIILTNFFIFLTASRVNETFSFSQISYIASIQQVGRPYCGGSAISPVWVLTAALCLYDIPVSEILVRVSAESPHEGGFLVGVEETLTYNDPYVGSYFDDVGLIRLAANLNIPLFATLPEVGDRLMEGDMIRIFGYGQVKEYGQSSYNLMTVEVPVISIEECRQVYGIEFVTDNMFCAYELYKDACQGDGGGPAISNSIQYGIISWGLGCGREGYPGVYTQLSNSWIRSWIYRNTNV